MQGWIGRMRFILMRGPPRVENARRIEARLADTALQWSDLEYNDDCYGHSMETGGIQVSRFQLRKFQIRFQLRKIQMTGLIEISRI